MHIARAKNTSIQYIGILNKKGLTMMRINNEHVMLKELQYKAAMLGAASLSIVSSDYKFLYELVR